MGKSFMFLLMGFILLSCGSEDGNPDLLEPLDLLPSDGEISGWQWDGTPSTAADQTSLYVLINGGAEEFVERGFVSGVLHRYSGSVEATTAGLELFIADQGSQSNARDIYDKRAEKMLFAEDTNIIYAEDARIDELTTLDSVVLDFWQQRFYVQVSLDNRLVAPELVTQTVIQFAENVSWAIES